MQQRGEAMQAASDATPSGMVSILGLELAKVEELCDTARGPGETLQIANRLCPGNIAISGDAAACERAAELAETTGRHEGCAAGGGRRVPHPMMDSAVDKLAGGPGRTCRCDRPRFPWSPMWTPVRTAIRKKSANC